MCYQPPYTQADVLVAATLASYSQGLFCRVLLDRFRDDAHSTQAGIIHRVWTCASCS